VSFLASSPTSVTVMTPAQFAERFGSPDLRGALCGYTREDDTRAVLALLCDAAPGRVLEIGTALGHMTANLTRWTPDEACVFTLDLIRGMPRAAPGAAEQEAEVPAHSEWGRFANHFGTGHKAFFITADSMTYDFGRLTPLDIVFIDGGHDLEHVLNDSRRAYDALVPGAWLVWHDFDSPVPWVKVREAIDQLGFAEPVVRVEGTKVACLRKGVAGPAALYDVGQFREGEPPCEPPSLGSQSGWDDASPSRGLVEGGPSSVGSQSGSDGASPTRVASPAEINPARAEPRPPGSSGNCPGSAAYVVKCSCDPGQDGSGGDTVVDHIRLFPLREDVRWTYRVHEQILPALRRAGVPVRWTVEGVRVTLMPTSSSRAERSPNPREGAIFLDLADQVFGRFQPQVLLTSSKRWFNRRIQRVAEPPGAIGPATRAARGV